MIAIPNMEKPKRCAECESFYIEFYMGEGKVGSACTLNDDDGSTIEADYNSCPLIEIVTCRECKWYDPPHIEYNDGTRKDFIEEDEMWETVDVGINCGGRCRYHFGLKIYCDAHDREDPEDEPNIIIFRKPDDFCSYGERRTNE